MQWGGLGVSAICPARSCATPPTACIKPTTRDPARPGTAAGGLAADGRRSHGTGGHRGLEGMARFEHFKSIPTRSQSRDSAYQHEVDRLSATADGLNPLTISHPAMTISCKNIGKATTS